MNDVDVESAPRRRSGRDRAVDVGLFLCAVGYGVVLSALLIDDPTVSPPGLIVDQAISAVACGALWLRRRWPVGLALGLVPVATFADLSFGALLVALFTVAVHRPVKVTAVVGAASLLTKSVFLLLVGLPGTELTGWLAFLATNTFAVVGWGLFIRHRRQLLLSLRERAARAEGEARLRAEQAQHHAREQIAREMHDVLGHRLSLLSVQAGALEYRPDASAEEIATATRVIRASAHQALQDLREVIGVLRAPVEELPQPTLADVHELVAESVRAGMRVQLRDGTAGTVPDRAARTAYRVVQEGLTNARKHAPGTDVSVTIAGAPQRGVTVEVCNGAASVTSNTTDVPGSGQGLIGLAERAALVAGRLEHGRTAAGGYRLFAWLP